MLDSRAGEAMDLSSASSRLKQESRRQSDRCEKSRTSICPRLAPTSSFLIENILKSCQKEQSLGQQDHLLARCLGPSAICQKYLIDQSCPPIETSSVLHKKVAHRSTIRQTQVEEEEEKKKKKKEKEKKLRDQLAKRRGRTMFNERQLRSLEWRFERNKYLTTRDRIRLAECLELDQLQVKTWFQVSVGASWTKRAPLARCVIRRPTRSRRGDKFKAEQPSVRARAR